MADDEGFSWVFESLVEFLKGPVWEAEVLSFIERKSVVFDLVEGDEEEYKEIYADYKNLVEETLGGHMKNLGIIAEDFKKACTETEKGIHSQFRKSLFEQLLAAGNYEIFKRMMMQKNTELQLQTLDLLAYQHGLRPESFLPGEDDELSAGERSIIKIVIERYMGEVDAQKQSEQEEVIQATKAQLEREGWKIEWRELMDQVSEEVAKLRMEYLKAQRDKLLVLKKEEREKLLQQRQETGRPQTAPGGLRSPVPKEKSEQRANSRVVEFRESLVAKLKAEVLCSEPSPSSPFTVMVIVDDKF